jgi:hypothetical protein
MQDLGGRSMRQEKEEGEVPKLRRVVIFNSDPAQIAVLLHSLLPESTVDIMSANLAG